MDIENHEFVLFLNCASQNNLRYLCIGKYEASFQPRQRSMGHCGAQRIAESCG